MAGQTGSTGAAFRPGVLRSVLMAELDRLGSGLTVVDIGGGSGGFAVPLAALGHHVTVIDPSPDALAALRRRAAERGELPGSVTAVQGDVTDLAAIAGDGKLDLVLCHSVLEVVDDPAVALAGVAAAVRPGGSVSLLAANRCATVLARALAGRFTEAEHAALDPAGRWGDGDAVLRRFDIAELTALAVGAGLQVAAVHGIRVLSDLVAGSCVDSDTGAAALERLELALAERSPYRDIAATLHVLARRG
ncbi:MAG: methyltransferase [Mycobacterium sp.]|nr:methyltransferase [Mycobacterium sp.]